MNREQKVALLLLDGWEAVSAKDLGMRYGDVVFRHPGRMQCVFIVPGYLDGLQEYVAGSSLDMAPTCAFDVASESSLDELMSALGGTL